jgi:hypothetical protein
LFLNSASGATQSITVTAAAHTLSFYNTGSVTLSGVASGTLEGTGTGVANRVSLTFTPTAGTLTLTVSGTITDVQLEAGSYPTSYIPTTSAAVTRAADAASKTGISSLIGQTEGTVYVDFNFLNNNNTTQVILSLAASGNSINDSVSLYKFGTNQLVADILKGGSSSGNLVASAIISSVFTSAGRYKVAFAYQSTGAGTGSYAIAVNGVILNATFTLTQAMSLGNTLSRLNLGRYPSDAFQLENPVNAAALYPTRLSNSELAQLTAL